MQGAKVAPPGSKKGNKYFDPSKKETPTTVPEIASIKQISGVKGLPTQKPIAGKSVGLLGNKSENEAKEITSRVKVLESQKTEKKIQMDTQEKPTNLKRSTLKSEDSKATDVNGHSVMLNTYLKQCADAGADASDDMAQMCLELAMVVLNENPGLCDNATGMMVYMCQMTFARQEPVSHSTIVTASPIDPNASDPCAFVPKAHRKECEDAIKNDPNFGIRDKTDSNSSGGSSESQQAFVQNFDPENIPQVAKYNFLELDKYSRMTKLRSAVGHDYSARTPEYDPTHANCKSMKHYFIPVGVPRPMSLYRSTPHAFEWMSLKFFSPVDGTIQDISYVENQYGTESNFTIGSSEYPGYYFNFFHLALDPNLINGSLVKAGQQIATLGNEESYSEIAVQVRTNSGEHHLISFLQVVTDDVLKEYKSRGVQTASDVIITKEQRDANPLACDDSEAGWFIGSGREGASEDMQFIIWAFESSDNWFFFD